MDTETQRDTGRRMPREGGRWEQRSERFGHKPGNTEDVQKLLEAGREARNGVSR